MSSARRLLVCLGSAILAVAQGAEPGRDQLAADFLDPPQQARPLVYWQWVNGNVTQDGIRLDLEWMQRVGIGGALLFDIGFRTPPVPQYVQQRVGFGTPEWERALRFAASEAARLGLDFGAQSSGGWSVSGGPGVAPGQAMKKLVWSEALLTRETPAPLRLATPPSNSGPFQDVPIAESFREPALYGDVAVIAFRLPEAEKAARPILSGASDIRVLDDGRYAEATELAPDPDGNAALLAHFTDAPPLAVTLAVRGALPKGAIEASADGIRFVSIVEFPGDIPQPAPVHTFALPLRTEKYWRIRFRGLTGPLSITEARFDFGARVDRGPEKAAFGVLARNENESAYANASARSNAMIHTRDIIDVTTHMAADGTLSWRPPRGTWIAMRFGWSLTGRRTVPATNESIGLEVDKLDPVAVRAFAAEHYDRYLRAGGRMNLAITDSWEAGQQNWTAAMISEFATRRGYDLRTWMPVLTGRVVGDAARSERFLADFRRTIADMLADHHYGVLASVARERGMTLYAEAAGTDLPTMIDGVQAKGRVGVPMGEYWFYPEGGVPKPNHIADVREAASAAHLYGHRIVAAEAFTTMGEEPWATGPAQLRRIADRFFAEGVNRIVLHTSAHQPFTDRRPGITLRQYGQHFTRNETWAEDAGAWTRYLARASYLLQQGRAVADVAVFLGEDAAASPPFHKPGDPNRFEGYDHDFLNAEALLTRIELQNGRLALPDGGSYGVLVVPPHVRRMSLPVIRKLRGLVEGGAVLIGPKPLGAFGLADSDERVLRIADDLWGRKPQLPMRKFGRGRVYAALDVVEVLEQEKIAPDVTVKGLHDLHWAHRATTEADIYFIANASAQPFRGEIRLRAQGRRAQLWDAVDGSRSPVDHSIAEQATTVRLDLAPRSSAFIVLRGSASAGRFAVEQRERGVLAHLDGTWDVKFLDGQGAPERTRLAAGISWTESLEPAIRYYSGRAQYSRTVAIPQSWLANDSRIELDLGAIGEMARVRVNDRDLGVSWNAPWRLDVSDALHAGDNRLEIVVTNYWANRLIGDEQLGAKRETFAPIRPYSATSPLRRSGLLGPVRLVGVGAPDPVVWNSAIVRHDGDWFATSQAVQIADSVVRYQSAEGGWPKNTNLATPPLKPADIPIDGRENTFDNDGTTLPMEFLAQVFTATGQRAHREAFERGLDYTLAAQYPNGGWPQFFPLREGYYSHVTFNDDAMVRVMELLRDIASGEAPYQFVDDRHREKVAQAVDRGIDLILRTQIRQNSALTAWCAQYDEHTLEPAWARRYEPPSISGSESVGILRFLMGIEKPTPEVISAIEGGVRWLRESAIAGIRVERFTNADGKSDRKVIADPTAAPLWARFYELGSNRPLFLGRDSIFRYAFAEIEQERRNGYNYYGTWAETLLKEDYPAWQRRIARR